MSGFVQPEPDENGSKTHKIYEKWPRPLNKVDKIRGTSRESNANKKGGDCTS